MGLSKSYRTLAAAAIAVLVATGCQAEHKKFASKQTQDWEKARLGIMFEVANQQYKVGDFDKCRDGLAKMLSSNVPFAPMHVLAAKVDLESSNSLEDAADHLKKAMEYSPTDPEAAYLLGVVYQRWQKFDMAAEYYQLASEKKPTEAIYVLAVAEMKISSGRLDEAKQLLEDKALYFEQSAAIQMALAKIATLQGDPAAAAKHLRDATLLVPEDKNIRWSYAQALFDAGKFSDAAKILEVMRKDPPTMPAARDSLSKGSDPKIDVEAAKATKVSLLMVLGQSYLEIRRPLDARDCFQEVIREQPDNLMAYLSLGKACLVTSDLNLTLAAAQKVLRTEPDNMDALLLQAAVQQKRKQWGDASKTLSNASRVSPENATVLTMQAYSELQLGKKGAAVSHLEKALAASPEDVWAQELMAQLQPPVAQRTQEASPKRIETITNAAPAETGGIVGRNGQ